MTGTNWLVRPIHNASASGDGRPSRANTTHDVAALTTASSRRENTQPPVFSTESSHRRSTTVWRRAGSSEQTPRRICGPCEIM